MKHKQTKHSDMVYGCDICDKVFVYKDSMLRHKNVLHSKIKTEYQCTLCPQAFKYKFNMKAHISKFHVNELL